MSDLSPERLLAARVIDVALVVHPRRIRAARKGRPDSGSVGIPWRHFLELLDALEAAYPGVLDRTRAADTTRAAAAHPDTGD